MRNGVLYLRATGITAEVAELQKAPTRATTRSRWISFSAAFTELAGLHWPSSMISSTGLPSTPPAALRSFTASRAPLASALPL